MKNVLYIFLVVFLFQPYNLLVSKEAKNHMCYKRGYEIIFPYQEAVFKLKEKLNVSADQKREELNKFKDHFEKVWPGFISGVQISVSLQDCVRYVEHIWAFL